MGEVIEIGKDKLIQYQKDPVLWYKEVLDDNDRWGKQDEIMESVRDHRNTYVKSCHGVGKTYTAKDVALWFLTCFYPSIVLTTAPSWPQVEKLLWAEINTSYSNCKVPLGGRCKKTELHFDDNWFALGISPRIDTDDDGKRLTGFHSENILVIFDEAPAVNLKLWDIKETLMTSKNVRFLAIGNPVLNSGPFYDGFTRDDVNSITMSMFDSPNFVQNDIKNVDDLIVIKDMDVKERELIYEKMEYPYPGLTNPRWAVERISEWGIDSPLTKSRVLSQFPERATDTIISLTSLEKCKNVEHDNDNRMYLGVDVARFGIDNTCFYGDKGNQHIYKDQWNGQDTVKTANRIKAKIREGYRTIIIDDTGLGGGVTDQVQHFIDESGLKDVDLIPVNFAEASTSNEYDGIVTDMYYNAKYMLDDEELQVVDEGKLFSELTARKYKFTNKGKIKVESKDDYKKRTGKNSPDEADAFILCQWGKRKRDDADLIIDVEGRVDWDEI